jgi:adenylate kinase
MFIVMLGAPGAGKGTQAKFISKELGFPQISSGDLFRVNMKNKTELGELAATYINKGELVPDDVTIAMVRERLAQDDCERGAILDGFPRTAAQAAALDDLLMEMHRKVDIVPFLEVPDALLIERLSGRWTCRAKGHIFHEKYSPPRQEGICDHDGSELYQREDDRVETVTHRIQVYMEQTAPLIEYYQERGLLTKIDASRSIEEIGNSLLALLKVGA